MGTLTTGNIKAGALGSSDSPAANTYLLRANSTFSSYESTTYNTGGQEIETFDFTENGLSTGEAFVYEKSGAGKLQGYPGFCIVSDQINGITDFVDRGPYEYPISAHDHVHHDSGGSVYKQDMQTIADSPTSIYFDGTSDKLIVAEKGDAKLAYGTGDFTVEFWINPQGSFGNEGIFCNNLGTDNDTEFMRISLIGSGTVSYIQYRLLDQGADTNEINLYSGGEAFESAGFHLTADTWYHIACVRHNGVATLWQNGEHQKSLSSAHNHTKYATEGIKIGLQRTSNWLSAYLDDIRFIVGKSIYNEPFTPPSRSPKGTEAYGDVADYTKITMMGYRSDSSSYFTAINYIAGDEVVARDYMGIGESELSPVVYSGETQKIMVYNSTTNTVKFTAYVETTT